MTLGTQTIINIERKKLDQQGVRCRSLCPGHNNPGCEILTEAHSGQPKRMCPNCFAAFQKQQKQKR